MKPNSRMSDRVEEPLTVFLGDLKQLPEPDAMEQVDLESPG